MILGGDSLKVNRLLCEPDKGATFFSVSVEAIQLAVGHQVVVEFEFNKILFQVHPEVLMKCVEDKRTAVN